MLFRDTCAYLWALVAVQLLIWAFVEPKSTRKATSTHSANSKDASIGPFDLDEMLSGSEGFDVNASYIFTMHETDCPKPSQIYIINGLEYKEFVEYAEQRMIMLNGKPYLCPEDCNQFFYEKKT